MDSHFSSRSASGTACATRARFPLTKATRRDVRRHVAFAAELGIYSVTLHNVVWTLNQKMQQFGPKRQDDPSSCKDQGGANSRRGERSTRRLQDFQRAVRFRLANIFKQWKQRGTQQMPLPALQPPSSLAPLPALPLPMPEAALSQQTNQLQQPREREDESRATKRDATASRSWATAPSTPPAKRMLALPPGLPPPSIPPSPPSSHPSPPHQGGKQPPEPSSNQTDDELASTGSAGRSDPGDSAGSPPDFDLIRILKLEPCAVCQRTYRGLRDDVAKVCSRCLDDEDDTWEWHAIEPDGSVVCHGPAGCQFNFGYNGERVPERLVFLR